MNLDFDKMDEETVSRMEKNIAFFKANKERIKKLVEDAKALGQEVQAWV